MTGRRVSGRIVVGMTALGAVALLGGCGSRSQHVDDASPTGFNVLAANVSGVPEPVDEPDALKLPPFNPPAPGRAGGLPLYKKPAVSSPFPEDAPPAALDVVERYYDELKRRDYANAYRLWRGEGARSGMSAHDFAASFARYREYRANIGQPGPIDAGAGQRFIKVPVQPYVRLRATGEPVYYIGAVTLHRTDVDGAAPDERRWRIESIDLTQVPG